MSGVKTTEYITPKTILSAPELAYTLPIKIANTGVTAGSDGKKILKAGTPITGDLTARGTAFKKATETAGGGSSAASTDAIGLLLHEVDVTNGTENGTILVSGAVDIAKIDATTAALYTTVTKTALNKIIFMKGV